MKHKNLQKKPQTNKIKEKNKKTKQKKNEKEKQKEQTETRKSIVFRVYFEK